MTSITPWVPITGDTSNGSNTVSGVSPTDIANVTVGAGVQNAAFPSGTVVDTVGASSFTVSNNATASASGATLFVSTAATTFTWDQDNRLTQVTLPDSAVITYTYDVQGRMLTRTDTSGTTLFEWDGMDCVRETAPSTGSAIYDTSTYDGSADYGSGGMTQYYVVNGALRQLVRDNAAYAVICDALGNVRLVLDDTGTTVSSFQYDAWGDVLPSTIDSLPMGTPYRFIGGRGCRYDEATGLTYMRARWYDGQVLLCFVSRDAIGRPNRYAYANSNPGRFTDPSGQDPQGTSTPTHSAQDANSVIYCACISQTKSGSCLICRYLCLVFKDSDDEAIPISKFAAGAVQQAVQQFMADAKANTEGRYPAYPDPLDLPGADGSTISVIATPATPSWAAANGYTLNNNTAAGPNGTFTVTLPAGSNCGSSITFSSLVH